MANFPVFGGFRSIVAIAFLFVAVFAVGETKSAEQPTSKLTLRTIMLQLERDYAAAAQGLFFENFAGLEHSANAIANHPLPNQMADAIKKTLASRFPDFERVDEQTHIAATQLAHRAAVRDLAGSAKALGTLAESCVACHKQFRAKLLPLTDRPF